MEVRDDEIRRLLREMSPWWRLQGASDPLAWAASDVTLRSARSFDIDYDPDVLRDVTTGGLYVLRGPRRVGKSVALKRHAMQQLVRDGTSPLDVIHVAVDGFAARDLRRALRLGRDLTSAGGDRPRLWLIDEITAVAGWAETMKSERDNTPLAWDTVIVTGSSAVGLDEARRTLGAGRTGPAVRPFRLLLPMTFRDFCRVSGRTLPDVSVTGPADLLSPVVKSELSALSPFLDDIDLAWQAYVETGGFPRAVAEQSQTGEVSAVFLQDLVNWLAPEVTPQENPESILRLLDALGTRSASPLNLTSTAAAIGLTRDRLRSHVGRLLGSFAALSCPQVDDEGSVVAGSQSKLYPMDTLLMRLPSLVDPAFADPPASLLTEAALAIALARAVDEVHPGRLLEGGAVAYARTGSGNEVDFAPLPIRVGGVANRTVPIESKWISSGWRSAALTIENRYGQGIVATKDILDLTHPTWAVPAGVVALMLG